MKTSHILFRFKSENKWEHAHFPGASIQVKQLKSKVAELRQLENNSYLQLLDSETNQVYNDEDLIQANEKILVERKKIVENDIIIEQHLVEQNTEQKNDKKTMYICKICNNQFKNPIQTSCCNQTACKECYENHLNQNYNTCFFCKKVPEKPPIPNTRLEKLLKLQLKWIEQKNDTDNNKKVDTQLLEMLNNSRYFIIKSANQENIEIARQNCE